MSDKELIKQEIERRIDLYSIAEKDDLTFARMGELSSLIDFIDSLPEEHNEDLEEAANFYTNTHTEWFDSEGNPHVMPAFKAGAEWQKQKDKQDFLDKAENAISMISRHYIGEDYSFEQVWEQFKNYMEDENN